MLRVGDDQVDALRFQALDRQAHEELAGGRPAAAAAGLADALALWRGDPLAEFAAESWAVAGGGPAGGGVRPCRRDRVERGWRWAGMLGRRPSWRRWWRRGRCRAALGAADRGGLPLRSGRPTLRTTSGAVQCWPANRAGLGRTGGLEAAVLPRTRRSTGTRLGRLRRYRLIPHRGRRGRFPGPRLAGAPPFPEEICRFGEFVHRPGPGAGSGPWLRWSQARVKMTLTGVGGVGQDPPRGGGRQAWVQPRLLPEARGCASCSPGPRCGWGG